MSSVYKTESFDEEGIAEFCFNSARIIASNRHIVNTFDYNIDWKENLDRIVRQDFQELYNLPPSKQDMLFRLNGMHAYGNSPSNPGIICISKCLRLIIVGGQVVPDTIYDEVLLWFHRLIKSVIPW